MSERLFTSESVTEGHPDKLADRVSDSILDHILAEDPSARVACETLVTTGLVLIAGEITTETYVEIPDIVRATLDEVGYSNPEFGIDAKTCAILTTIDRQADEIAQGVDPGGAGDQGMMFGYASDETEAHMPAPILYSHRLTQGLARLRRSGELPWLRPDGKAQVTVAYRDDRPVRIETVVVSAQHGPDISRPGIEEAIREHLLRPLLPEELYDPATAHVHINPTGSFMTGGPQGDAGLTGRKIIVDTYGGVGRHGGGAFSGKDATKVDRSGAYAARWAARTVVAAGLARRCEIQLAYAIGVPEPVSIWVDTQGTGTEPDDVISKAVGEVFDFRPRGIIQDLGLRSPLYTPTSAYGHFGRPSRADTRLGRDVVLFPWERLDRVEALRAAI